jgi:hypothetical protein
VVRLIAVNVIAPHKLALVFRDLSQGVFDGASYLASRRGRLLENLRDPAYFARCFVDTGALCWPNGLELSADRLRELAGGTETNN